MEIYDFKISIEPPSRSDLSSRYPSLGTRDGCLKCKKSNIYYLDLLTGKSLTVHAHCGRFSILLAVEGDKGVALPRVVHVRHQTKLLELVL